MIGITVRIIILVQMQKSNQTLNPGPQTLNPKPSKPNLICVLPVDGRIWKYLPATDFLLEALVHAKVGTMGPSMGPQSWVPFMYVYVYPNIYIYIYHHIYIYICISSATWT